MTIYMTVLYIHTSGDQYFIIFCCGTAPALNYCKSSNKKIYISLMSVN